MTDYLARWLGEQLDEDERIARAAGGATWLEFSEGGWVYAAPAPMTEWKGPGDDGHHVASVRLASERAHILHHDPARVLREIEMKRSLVAAYADALTVGPDVSGGYTRPIREAFARQARNFLIVLAMPYSDRPGFAEAIATVE